jgi:hypothetical protein
MSNPITKISEGLFSTITTIMTSKEGLTVFFLVLTIFILILWLAKVIKTNGGFITLISFMITIFMCWITWVGC